MPRIKKIKNAALEEIPAESAGINLDKPPNFSKNQHKSFRIDRLTLREFILITVYCSAVLLIFISLTVANSLVSMMVKESRNSRNFSPTCSKAPCSNTKGITYTVEKNKYTIGDQAKLSIVNNSDKSIYLVPCQYFNKFEHWNGNAWQTVFLDDCSNTAEQMSSAFERVPKRVEEKIPTAILGQGLWRGVSDVFFNCQKAKIESCQGKQTLYSNEFTIQPKTEISEINKKAPSAKF